MYTITPEGTLPVVLEKLAAKMVPYRVKMQKKSMHRIKSIWSWAGVRLLMCQKSGSFITDPLPADPSFRAWQLHKRGMRGDGASSAGNAAKP